MATARNLTSQPLENCIETLTLSYVAKRQSIVATAGEAVLMVRR